MGFPDGSVVKNLPATAGDVGLIPGLGRYPGEGNGNPSSILAWKSHRQRSLVGYSPWSHESVGHHLATKQQHVLVCNTCIPFRLKFKDKRAI